MSRSWGRRWACIGLVAVGSLGAALMVNVLIKTGARPRLAEILGEQKPEIPFMESDPADAAWCGPDISGRPALKFRL